ncbi:MAG TPA: acetoacetate--CoA ligase [Thermoleophilaceae bacterium]|nr:acetoacetate--CoA ligase [Thermoleophilaceae bacterium]
MTASGEGTILWEPSPERRERAAMTRYLRWLAAERGLRSEGYHELWRWSVEELEGFWASIWDYFEVRSARPYERVLAERTMPGARWFEGAELSYAEHIFRDRPDDRVAVVHASELRERGELTWAELRDASARIAAGLRSVGVERGDRVVAYMPNIPETVAAFLACASIGAVWSSCSPDFGPKSVIDRFAQIEPKVLLCVDGYRYNGRDHDRMDVVAGLQAAMPGLERTVVLPYLDSRPDLGRLERAMPWDAVMEAGSGASLATEPVPFDHPLWVLYSSGTTGLPKAIVQGQGGILLEHLKKLHLHVDARAGDRLFWFTTTGWMMWNFLVGGLLTDAAIVLYDGSPAYPDMGVLWDLAQDAGMSCFGTSASYISGCMKAGVEPAAGRDLSALRSVGSTGSPLSPEGFRWVYDHLGGDTWLFSTSGGTDVCTAFVGGVPVLPVHQGELQARSLGAKVESFDEEGRPLIGEVGELVITEPMPSMPLYLWNDPDGERYRESYFGMYPGIWRHGDWIEITPRGTAVIYGRSDSTINRGGVRMGTSEIYGAVLGLPEVVDALVVDVQRPGEEAWMPLFVVLREGQELDEQLEREIRRRIRDDCSPRHVPSEVLAIDEVPRTLSGKVLEVPVKRILTGTPPERAASRESLQNPAALDWFVELARRRGMAAAAPADGQERRVR